MKSFVLVLFLLSGSLATKIPDIDWEDYEDLFETTVKSTFKEGLNEEGFEKDIDQEKTSEDFDDYSEEIETPVKYNLTEIFSNTPEKDQKVETTIGKEKIQKDIQDFYDDEKTTVLNSKYKVSSEKSEKKVNLTKSDDRLTITLKVDKDTMGPTTIEVKVPTKKGDKTKKFNIPYEGNVIFNILNIS